MERAPEPIERGSRRVYDAEAMDAYISRLHARIATLHAQLRRPDATPYEEAPLPDPPEPRDRPSRTWTTGAPAEGAREAPLMASEPSDVIEPSNVIEPSADVFEPADAIEPADVFEPAGLIEPAGVIDPSERAIMVARAARAEVSTPTPPRPPAPPVKGVRATLDRFRRHHPAPQAAAPAIDPPAAEPFAWLEEHPERPDQPAGEVEAEFWSRSGHVESVDDPDFLDRLGDRS